jgi:hypothetical protein
MGSFNIPGTIVTTVTGVFEGVLLGIDVGLGEEVCLGVGVDLIDMEVKLGTGPARILDEEFDALSFKGKIVVNKLSFGGKIIPEKMRENNTPLTTII